MEPLNLTFSKSVGSTRTLPLIQCTFIVYILKLLTIMPSVFTKIINGDIPSYKIAETEDFYAFLDINPNAKGHTLCIPKREVDYVFDLENEEYLGLMQFAKRTAKAIEAVVPCDRIGIAVVGLEVPHVHIHLIPLTSMEDMKFEKKVTLSEEEFSDLAQKISSMF